MTASTSGPSAGSVGPARSPLYARPRSRGIALGRLPMGNLVIAEVGLAVALGLLAVSPALLPLALVVLALAIGLAGLRWRQRWLTQWIGLTTRYQLRPHDLLARPTDRAEEQPAGTAAPALVGSADPRVTLLRLAVPDLVVAKGTDHERRAVGFAWHAGTWTAVLLVDPTPALVGQLGGSPTLPLAALVPCLEDRGVVLDAIQVIWHCYPGSTTLPPSSPALASYLEVLGPLPAAARRTTWVAIRLDPRRCAAAVAERGGGVVGAHRALVGALSRVRSALAENGVPTRPLDPDELLRAGIAAAELTSVAGTPRPVAMRERWSGVTAGGVGHASYAITGWRTRGAPQSLNALTGVRALSATVALSLTPADGDGEVGLRGVVRVSARTPTELEQAEGRLRALAERVGVTLTPLRGLQAAALAATLPLGGAA